MIDKSQRGDYEGVMHRWSGCLRLLSLVLLWTVLAGGCQPSEPKVRVGNPGRGGERLDITSLLSKGRTTAFDFFSPYCYPCVRLAPVLEKLAARMPEVAFVKLDINRPQVRGIDWRSPLAQQYRLRSVPYFMIFDPQGKLVAEGAEAQKMVKEWLQKTSLIPQARK
jgi:thiol-disulfide isomerase/thioredoxin